MAFSPFRSPYSPYGKIKENELCLYNGLTSPQMSAREYPKDLSHIMYSLKKQWTSFWSRHKFGIPGLSHCLCDTKKSVLITSAISKMAKFRSSFWYRGLWCETTEGWDEAWSLLLLSLLAPDFSGKKSSDISCKSTLLCWIMLVDKEARAKWHTASYTCHIV